MDTAHPALLALLVSTLAACAGPPFPSDLEEEPICVDFPQGAAHTKMHGGLRQPVTLTVLEGNKPVVHVVLNGIRAQKAPKTQISLPDADAEYTVEWAQCPSRQGPKPIAEPEPKADCPDAKVYKTDKLVTKKGEPASHKLVFPLPPEAGCWLDEQAPPPPPPAAPLAPGGGAVPMAGDAGAAPPK